MGLYYHKIDFFSRLVVDIYIRYNHRTIEIGGIGVEDYLLVLSQYRKQEVLRSNEYDSTFQVRINSEIKRAVEDVYAKTGMTLTDAIRGLNRLLE